MSGRWTEKAPPPKERNGYTPTPPSRPIWAGSAPAGKLSASNQAGTGWWRAGLRSSPPDFPGR